MEERIDFDQELGKILQPAVEDAVEEMSSTRKRYVSQAYFTRKQIPAEKRKRLRKIARKSRKTNYRKAKGK